MADGMVVQWLARAFTKDSATICMLGQLVGLTCCSSLVMDWQPS